MDHSHMDHSDMDHGDHGGHGGHGDMGGAQCKMNVCLLEKPTSTPQGAAFSQASRLTAAR